jgi:DNA-binding IclR family transcriptional regulator
MGLEVKNGKSYRRIKTVKPTIEILIFLSNQREPVTGQAVSSGLGIKYDTVMCYLASLEDFRFVRRCGEFYELGQESALLWSRRRARLRSIIDESTEDLAELEV